MSDGSNAAFDASVLSGSGLPQELVREILDDARDFSIRLYSKPLKDLSPSEVESVACAVGLMRDVQRVATQTDSRQLEQEIDNQIRKGQMQCLITIPR